MNSINIFGQGKSCHNFEEMFAFEVQSNFGATNSSVHASNSMHTTISGGGASVIKALDDGMSSDADIGNFLSRKVRIAQYTWTPSANFTHVLNPWEAFLNNAAVQNKLANYYLLKGDLEITILVNGTPFHAGMLLASYSYMSVVSEIFTVGGDTHSVTRSQRPHCWLNLSTDKSGCICVPFFSPTPYLSLGDATTSAADLGTLNIDSLRPLIQINAGSDVVSVAVFARLVNVKLTAPTQRVVTISGNSQVDIESLFVFEVQADTSKNPDDEYDTKGVISGPASAIADYAGYFTNIPYIGPFATATQMGATAVGGIAQLFGYSRPIQLADVMPMRNTVVSSLALTEGGDTSQKLTVTGKQELTIDPSTVGFDGTDELTIKHMSQVESYLTQFEWPVTAALSDYLFSIDVDPMAERRDAEPGGFRIIPTSLSFLSRAFSEWSGTIKFRFQVIASQYHRGRLGIIYDPYGGSGTNPYNTTFNTVLDLAEARDITLAVNWQNDRPYLECDGTNTRDFWQTAVPEARIVHRDFANGVLYVQVINELVVPDAVSSAHILVSISAGDDFELVNPRGENIQVFPDPIVTISGESKIDISSLFKYEVQASATEITPVDENSPEGENVVDVTTAVVITRPEKPLMYYGERIMSIRQLLKRSCLWRTMGVFTAATTAEKYSWVMKAFPTTGGYDPAGQDSAIGPIPFWYNNSTYLTYFKYYFAGWRGSIRYKFCPNSEIHNIYAQRYTGATARATASTFRPLTTQAVLRGQSTSVSAHNGIIDAKHSSAGSALTQNRTMDALEVEIPYHINLRFSRTHAVFNAVNTNTIGNAYPGGDAFVLLAHTPYSASSIFNCAVYVAAGEDFNFFGRVGAPVLYSYALPASA